MIHLILLGFAGTACYLLLCAVKPMAKCRRCGGLRAVTGKGGGHVPCPKCRGAGRARRPGAATVHRVLWDHAGPWAREQLRDLAGRLRGDG